MKGAIYEPLVVATVAGGGHVYPWLAQSWKWSNGNKTLTLQIADERQVVGWSAADGRRRGLQPDGRQAGQGDGHHRPLPRRLEHRLDQAGRGQRRRDHAQDARLAVHRRQPEPAVHRAAAHLVEGRQAGDVQEPQAGRLGPVHEHHAPDDAGHRLRQEPDVLEGRRRRRSRASSTTETTSNDAALLSIQSGKVDWTHNFVPNVESAYEAKDPAHYHAFYATTAYPISLMFDDTQYPYSLVPFRQAVSMAINRNDVSKLGEYGYAPPTDAIGLGGIFPSWVTDPADQGRGQARSRPTTRTAAKKLLTDSGFTYNGSKLIDPKGNPVSFQVARDRRLVATGSPRCRSSPRTSRPSASTRPSSSSPTGTPGTRARPARRRRRCSGRTPRRARRTGSSTPTCTRTP